MSTEFERILRIRGALDRSAPQALVSNGDDAAVFALTRPTAVSVDTCMEDTHFKTAWLSLEDVGWRSQVSALSDLTAMGAQARFVIIALAAPKDFADEALDALCSGIGEALDQAGAVLIGGNVSASPKLSVTTTAIGEIVAEPILRSGAKVGDGLYVTGSLGGSGMGLSSLLGHNANASSEDVAHAVACWRRPRLRTNLAAAISEYATACIDVSDGLGQDLGHLAKASGVGFDVEAQALPLALCVPQETAEYLEDGYLEAWRSGEEYELLFTASEQPSFEAKRIGVASREPGLRLLSHGRLIATEHAQGFDHFR